MTSEKNATADMAARSVADLIDHTLLKPEAVAAQIDQLCREAAEYRFAAVCVNPTFVPQASRLLKGTPVQVCTVAGFPLGAHQTEIKVQETRLAIEQGASEVDMVINIGDLKSGDDRLVLSDIQGVVKACHEEGAICKVIIECVLLTEAEKVRACALVREAGADFIKTSTGFAGGGATVEDVALMHRAVSSAKIGVKAAGGIRTYADFRRMVEAGATRIGTSSGGKIIQEALEAARSSK